MGSSKPGPAVGLVAALLISFISGLPCSLEAQGQHADPESTPAVSASSSSSALIREMVNSVSAESLMATVRSLQGFGTRYEFSPQRDSVAAYLVRRLESLGIQARQEPYTSFVQTLYDIAVVSEQEAFAVGGAGLIVGTTDGGNSWCQLYQHPLGPTISGVDFADRRHGWAVGGGFCYRTADAGESWDRRSITTNTLYAVAFLDSLTGLAAGAGGTLMRTTDGGTSWSARASLAGSATLRELNVVDSHHCWAVGDSGVIVLSQDAGLTWSRQTAPIDDAFVAVDFADERRGWIVSGTGDQTAGQAEGSVLRTTDGGAHWEKLVKPLEAYSLRGVCALDSAHVWITDPRGRIFQSRDGGNTWLLNLDLMGGNLGCFTAKIRAMRPSHIAFVGNQLYMSTNGAETWEDQTDNLPSSINHRSVNVEAVIPGRLIPERECLFLAHYDDASKTPMVAAPGADDNASGVSFVLEAARICRNYHFASTLRFLAVSGEELGSFGSTWYALNAARSKRQFAGVFNADMIGHPTTGDTTRVVIASFLHPSWLQDSMLTFAKRHGIGGHFIAVVDSPITATDHEPFAVAGYPAVWLAEGTLDEIVAADRVFHTQGDTAGRLTASMLRLATQMGLAAGAELAGPLERATNVEMKDPLPTEVVLRQNYPNPFNPSTTIRYFLPRRSHVRLTVYSILGQEVTNVVNDEIDAGNHEVRFTNDNLASGVYIYRLRAGERVLSRSMLLIR